MEVLKLDNLLKRLCECYGPSANEGRVADIIEAEISPFVDEIKKDALGNLIAVRHGGEKKLWLSAPMDQVCFLTTHVEDNGYIKFVPIGRTDEGTVLNSRVVFENGLQGVICRDLNIGGLYIDTGIRDGRGVREVIAPGAAAVLKGEFYDSEDIVISPSLHGRAACSCLIDIIKNCSKDIKNSLYFAFTSFGMVEARGSKTASFSIAPDVGIGITVTPSGIGDVDLGRGPVLMLRDGMAVGNKELISRFDKTAAAMNIPVQKQVTLEDVSDTAGLIQNGFTTKILSIAMAASNYHSASEIISKKDMENLKSLVLEAVNKETLFS